jgi:hypothetical protein
VNKPSWEKSMTNKDRSVSKSTKNHKKVLAKENKSKARKSAKDRKKIDYLVSAAPLTI